MAGEIVNLVLFDSVLFERGHMVARWAESMERNFTRHAREAAPLNKRINKSHLSHEPVGELKRGIHGDADRIGPKHWQVTVSSDASYSIYVLMGTPRTIFPNKADRLRLPWNPGFSPSYVSPGHESRYTFVSGQSPQNFLAVAAGMTAVTNSSLRGFEHQIGQQF